MSQTTPARKRIVIAPGHNPQHTGCSGNGLIEYTEAVRVVGHLDMMLNQAGFEVCIVEGPLTTKIKKAVNYNPDAAIEIHFNASEIPQANGIETLFGSNPQDKILAAAIQRELFTELKLNGRGIKFADYQGTPELDECAWPRLIDAPAVIVEALFLTNQTDAELLKEDGAHYRIAQSVTDGVRNYFDAQESRKLQRQLRRIKDE